MDSIVESLAQEFARRPRIASNLTGESDDERDAIERSGWMSRELACATLPHVQSRFKRIGPRIQYANEVYKPGK